MSYKAEFIADNSGQWAGNGLVFATTDEAATYAADLYSRWMSVKDTRVVETDKVANYRIADGVMGRIA